MKLLVLKIMAVFMLLGATSSFANTAAHSEEKLSTHKEETYKSQDFLRWLVDFCVQQVYMHL